jgi:hypothetical protein
MVKSHQASEAQLNAWIASLSSSGDILAKRAAVQSAEAKRQQRLAKKRQREDKFKRCTGGDVERRTGVNNRVKTTSSASKQETNNFDEATKNNVQEVEDYAKQLTALSLLIKNTSKLDPKQKHREMYSPGKPPAASVSKRKLNLEPRKSDYGGIGLARPSLWIALDEQGWRSKLNQNFIEHIPGFFGKHRTNAMKKQLDSDMLWKQLLIKKQSMERSGQRSNVS